MLKFAIIGFGGLGKVHFNNYFTINKENRANTQLVALCDIREETFTKAAATNITDGKSASTESFRKYSDHKELLAKEDLDFVVTALPTYLHAQIAVDALNAGVHVFSEKPMALELESCQAMLDAAKKNGKKLMIGQCVRYFPAYSKLKEIIDSKTYGKVVRAEFKRYSAFPAWSWNDWMRDSSKSGGAILDLHVHDVDFVNYVFGKPDALFCSATHQCTSFDSAITNFYYGDTLISCFSDWGIHAKFPFSATFIARFEKATLVFDGKDLIAYKDGCEPETLETSSCDGYVEEMVDFISCIENDTVSKINPPESSMQTIKLVMAEMESAKCRRVVEL